MASRRIPKVFAVGPFPPPVNGMAVATERFGDVLDSCTANVVKLNNSGRRLRRSATYHAVRMARTVRAVGALFRQARAGDALYLACDAGYGMVYMLVILMTARLLGLRRFVHHHSYAYMSERSRLMSVVVRGAGPSAVHIVSCAEQADRFCAHYRRARSIEIIPIAYVLEEKREIVQRPALEGRPFKLGHMGNLTKDKGLLVVFDTLRAARLAGLDVELVVAGPSPSDEDAALLQSAMAAAAEATSLGPVYGDAKERFFSAIDAFVFPTKYRHESFGIVAAEAMARGIPVIVFRTGCLDAAWVGGGGLVLEPNGDFVSAAVERLRRWTEEPDTHAAARVSARMQAEAKRADATVSALALAHRIIGASEVETRNPANQRVDSGLTDPEAERS